MIALIIEGKDTLFEGQCNGDITKVKSGIEGFGYDSIFLPQGSAKTFAEMKKEEKGTISHRGKSVKKLVNFLTTN